MQVCGHTGFQTHNPKIAVYRSQDYVSFLLATLPTVLCMYEDRLKMCVLSSPMVTLVLFKRSVTLKVNDCKVCVSFN